MNRTPLLLLGAFLALAGAVWGMISVHADGSHDRAAPEAVTHQELEVYMKVLQKDHEMIRLEQRVQFEAIKEAIK